MLRLAILGPLLFSANLALAGDDFGSREEAEALAGRMIALIDADGIEAAVEAMHNPEYPFVSARMGVNLFQGSMVVADNREPESVAADYSEVADLTGEIVWPRVIAAAQEGGDAMLLWYHYDTQEAYEYHCYSKRAGRDDGLVMVCR